MEIRDTMTGFRENLSDYRIIAMMRDGQYQMYNLNQQDSHKLFQDFPLALDDVPSPSDLGSPREQASSVTGCLGYLRGAFKQPIFTKEAWHWVLLERRRLQKVVADFHRCNQDILFFQPILLASITVTRQDIRDIAHSVNETGPTGDGAPPLLSHLRLRQVAENPGPTADDGELL